MASKKVKEERARAYRHWTKPEEASLVREARRGMYLEDIALAHGRSEAAIEKRAVKLELALARRPKANSVGSETVAKPSWASRLLFRRG